jgi:hypothetical protein
MTADIGLAYVLYHLPGVLVKHEIVLHDQEAWRFSSRMVMSRRDVKARRTSREVEPQRSNALRKQVVIRFGLAGLLILFILFAMVGTIHYWQGWLYWMILVLPMLSACLLLVYSAHGTANYQ